MALHGVKVMSLALLLTQMLGQLVFYKNGASQGVLASALSSDTYYFVWGCDSGSTNTWTVHANFGQRPFAHTPPTGFKSLCTTNLDDPLIADGSDYFAAKTYSGIGGTQSITGLEFAPDLVWVKNRSSNRNHYLYDAIRGAGTSGDLAPNTTDAEDSLNTGLYGYLSAFTSDGFTVVNGTDSSGNFNSSSQSYIAWAWDGGDLVTNSAYNQSQTWSSGMKTTTTATTTYSTTGRTTTFPAGTNETPFNGGPDRFSV